jgi:hypothetical protein
MSGQTLDAVTREIARDPLAADLVISLFSLQIGTDFLPPPPADFADGEPLAILASLPKTADLATIATDAELADRHGIQTLNLLRWALTAPGSRFVSLRPELRFPQFPCAHQFLAPRELSGGDEVFEALKATRGSVFAWHGSPGGRWHSIIREGLKNMTGTRAMVHGSAHGEGIYLPHKSGAAWGYVTPSQNRYANSALGTELRVIALCEMAKIDAAGESVTITKGNGEGVTVSGALRDHGWTHTLTMEAACAVRALFVNGEFDVNAIENPPARIPTLAEVTGQ